MSEPKPILVEIAPGELMDKITILQIKQERIDDAAKLKNVAKELQTLQRASDVAVADSPELQALCEQLKGVNESLWEIEDDIRDCERNGDFGEKFVDLARAVYRTNDKRADLKRQINVLLGAAFLEEKSYAAY